MITRYADPRVDAISCDEAKVKRWQDSELAVIEARVNLNLAPRNVFETTKAILEANPCDIGWWLRREKETQHDLTAFIDERLRYIPPEMQAEWHKDMTSYDTEDAAFALALLQFAAIVSEDLEKLIGLMKGFALRERYTLMLERTHGQWAKLRSFGGRILTWLAPLLFAHEQLKRAAANCRQSRISGAIGNYGGGLSPEIEFEALRILGLTPFYGATQILPRIVQAPLAQSVRLVGEALGQIAVDFRLGARSGKSLWHEPFAKEQKGSSAMPHKKNTIGTEQIDGMLDLLSGSEASVLRSIQTWEARAIEQSCVERVAWPDLFHEILRMISVMHRVLGGMVIYRDHMLQEIQDSRETYASDEEKNFLALECGKRGIEFETAYRIVQLASFCAFKPTEYWAKVRETRPSFDLREADELLQESYNAPFKQSLGIKEIIKKGKLFRVEGLKATEKDVASWNVFLSEIFSGADTRARWDALFNPSYLLKGEGFLFSKILG
ncbi:hypothetical protein A3G54_03165 [Candidatus Giovannonibacteria bacterium RIFCSPLOWO2_12_FULL_44_15]|uniref:Fumarate lyase N-terminal domain-containing protein n=1 Tax=Candidatus Giovannonibacteria bacterium RIFCSPLOWO2_12_FULL_44_15 TaxID=1798364 RepID=A0A1F5XZ21_9BACT|nr:MAG: hypothetical protein A3G54_03165 [Candidatus Giovannonibacteria bacterium RIFCSPLOWO2_12_FULL_44_15]